jgi:hypothetical protein
MVDFTPVGSYLLGVDIHLANQAVPRIADLVQVRELVIGVIGELVGSFAGGTRSFASR